VCALLKGAVQNNFHIPPLTTIKKGNHPKRSFNKEIVLIYLDPLPPPPKKEIKNKEIFISFLIPSLLPKIRNLNSF